MNIEDFNNEEKQLAIELLIRSKKFLWNGKGELTCTVKSEFVCTCLLMDTEEDDVVHKLHTLISYRLERYRTIKVWLHRIVGIPLEELTNKPVQQYRKEWIDSMIKEFKQSLKEKL